MKYSVKSKSKTLLADTLTPVGIFMRIREHFKNSVLLEGADYHAKHSSFTYIACDPVASFILDNDLINMTYPDGKSLNIELTDRRLAMASLKDFASSFINVKNDNGLNSNGLFGHMAYDAVNYFEDIVTQTKTAENEIPQMMYRVYRYVIANNHFKNEMHLFEHAYAPEGTEPTFKAEGIEMLEFLVSNPKKKSEAFVAKNIEETNINDEDMREIITKCIGHCLRGDVFQIVPSRRYSRDFVGDDFNVYRALRSINPSPYLFFFDHEDYHIFGSSPEKQIFIKGNTAEIHPIAGTFRRTGDDLKDAQIAQELLNDPKESAEHVMLVDLARNDLSRNCTHVQVDIFKEVQYFSHVIHLVSKVTGTMNEGANPLQLVADTFPAGTLSGSPKHMAMSLIDKFEPTYRGIYGGAIGFMDFECNFNHAIAIRTFLSKNNTLYYQAGMGVVAKSNIETEMAEIHLKLGALRKAIEMAETIL